MRIRELLKLTKLPKKVMCINQGQGNNYPLYESI